MQRALRGCRFGVEGFGKFDALRRGAFRVAGTQRYSGLDIAFNSTELEAKQPREQNSLTGKLGVIEDVVATLMMKGIFC